MNVIPVTIRLFGIVLTFVIPANKIFIFFYGIIFWVLMGPVIKYVSKEIIRSLGSILGGTYVQKNEHVGHERSPADNYQYHF